MIEFVNLFRVFRHCERRSRAAISCMRKGRRDIKHSKNANTIKKI